MYHFSWGLSQPYALAANVKTLIRSRLSKAATKKYLFANCLNYEPHNIDHSVPLWIQYPFRCSSFSCVSLHGWLLALLPNHDRSAATTTSSTARHHHNHKMLFVICYSIFFSSIFLVHSFIYPPSMCRRRWLAGWAGWKSHSVRLNAMNIAWKKHIGKVVNLFSNWCFVSLSWIVGESTQNIIYGRLKIAFSADRL